MRYKGSLIGNRFGRLVVIDSAGKSKHRNLLVLVKCDCGNQKIVIANNLRYGTTKSCGCLATGLRRLAKLRHGMSGTPEHISWSAMKERCLTSSNPGYIDYGGRGITICDRWMSFEKFYEDMGPRPKGASLGRIDNNGPYDPSNCRWETAEQQANNRRVSNIINIDGESLTISQWSRKVGIKRVTIAARIRLGWDAYLAISTPTRKFTRKGMHANV